MRNYVMLFEEMGPQGLAYRMFPALAGVGSEGDYSEYLAGVFPGSPLPVLFKGLRDKSGSVHDTPGYSFYAEEYGVAERYADSTGVRAYLLDAGTVGQFAADTGRSDVRRQEERFVNGCGLDAVRLRTYDLGGWQAQWAVRKSVARLELGTAEDVAGFRDWVASKK